MFTRSFNLDLASGRLTPDLDIDNPTPPLGVPVVHWETDSELRDRIRYVVGNEYGAHFRQRYEIATGADLEQIAGMFSLRRRRT